MLAANVARYIRFSFAFISAGTSSTCLFLYLEGRNMAADDYVRDMTAQSTAHSSTSAIVGVHEKQPSVLPGPTEMTERQKMMNGADYGRFADDNLYADAPR